MPSANRDNFTYAFPIWMTFVSCLIALASISSTILDKSGAKGQCCLIPDLREKAFSFSPLSIILSADLSFMAFIMLRYVHCIPLC